MQRFLWSGLVWAALAASPATAQFSGNFELQPAGCEATGQCTLTFDLRYRDPTGLEWLAAANNKTDGASIPPWAQLFIGRPFDPSYIKAAVIHDHYCDRHVRSWRATHRVFYDALRELGIDQVKAKIMYYAVYVGGPKWVELIPGKTCGRNCLFKTPALGGVEAKASAIAGPTVYARPAMYDQPGFVEDLKEVEKLIGQYGDKVDLDFLEKRAENMKPNDFYYLNGDKVTIGGGAPVE